MASGDFDLLADRLAGRISFNGSIGVTKAGNSALTSADLVRAADRALYPRKASRSRSIEIISP